MGLLHESKRSVFTLLNSSCLAITRLRFLNRFSPGRELHKLLPLSPSGPPSQGLTAKGDKQDVGVKDAEEELDPKSVAVEDSRVGDELVTLDEHGPGALEPKPMASPKAMTPRKKSQAFHITLTIRSGL